MSQTQRSSSSVHLCAVLVYSKPFAQLVFVIFALRKRFEMSITGQGMKQTFHKPPWNENYPGSLSGLVLNTQSPNILPD
jgi:hypothetical protein